MYYSCSENKGADQLRGYREADLRLCFRICKNPLFSRRGSYCAQRKILNATCNVAINKLGRPVMEPVDLCLPTRSCRFIDDLAVSCLKTSWVVLTHAWDIKVSSFPLLASGSIFIAHN